MKKLFSSIFLLNLLFSAEAQHYIGVFYSPYLTLNTSTDYGSAGGPATTFGYGIGLQGLIRTQKRISFSYGLQYTYQYTYFPEFYKKTSSSTSERILEPEDIVGYKEIIKLIELPTTWRYNFTLNRKFQPYFSISPTLLYPFYYKMINIDGNGNEYSHDQLKYPLILPDIGLGANYKAGEWMFNAQITYRPVSILKRVGLSISVMRKF